jgi:hypothetical protein
MLNRVQRYTYSRLSDARTKKYLTIADVVIIYQVFIVNPKHVPCFDKDGKISCQANAIGLISLCYHSYQIELENPISMNFLT